MLKLLNLNKELLLIKFPIFFPLIYGIILFTFPQFELHLIFLTILILAEPHFGATWPFFINKVNTSYIREKKLWLIYLPIVVLLSSLFGFIFFRNLFLLIFFAANIYHVTRQSFGICKLYCERIDEKKFQEILLYLVNFIFFIIAFFRFYIPMINENNIMVINILVSLLVLIIFVLYILRFGFSQNFLTFVTGCIIFSPVCFVNNPVHAIIMGVTMHYSQYLYLTYFIYKRREEEVVEHQNQKLFGIKYYKYFFTISIYAIIMAILSLSRMYDDTVILKNLLIIPIMGQMLHFYLDSQLWKFSEAHNRATVLKYIKQIPQKI